MLWAVVGGVAMAVIRGVAVAVGGVAVAVVGGVAVGCRGAVSGRSHQNSKTTTLWLWVA